MKWIKERPVVFWGSITTLASATIGLLAAFEAIMWTTAQMGQVMVVLAAVGQMFVFLIQGQVTPTQNPKDDGGNPLTPGPIGDVDPEALTPPNMP